MKYREYGTGDYMDSQRKDANDQSARTAEASHDRLVWGPDHVALLLTWDRSNEELTVMAQILGRTREACRERYYAALRGDVPAQPRSFTRTTVTETWNYRSWSDCDDYDSRWYR